MPQERPRADREWMPVTIVLPMLLSATLVAAWIAAGFILVWLFRAFPTPANGTSSILWSVVVLLGLLVNMTILIGLARRTAWMRWVVVAQALAMIALLIATPLGLWAVLVCGGQSVLLSLPPSRRWFRGRPIPQAALVETS